MFLSSKADENRLPYSFEINASSWDSCSDMTCRVFLIFSARYMNILPIPTCITISPDSPRAIFQNICIPSQSYDRKVT